MDPQDIDSFFLPGGILASDENASSLDLGLSSILGASRRAKSGGARTSRLFSAEDENEIGLSSDQQQEDRRHGEIPSTTSVRHTTPLSPKRSEEDASRLSSMAGINPMAKEFTPFIPESLSRDEIFDESVQFDDFGPDGVFYGGEKIGVCIFLGASISHVLIFLHVCDS